METCGWVFVMIYVVVLLTKLWSDGRYMYEDCSDHVGKQFLVMFSEHHKTGAMLKLYFSTLLASSVSVRIQTPIWDTDNVDITLTVTDTSVTVVDLPESLRMTGTGKGTKSILVTAGDFIMLYAADVQINSADAFLVYPTEVLGTEYMNVIFNQTSTSYFSSLGAVALYDLTTVEIDPPPYGSVTYDGAVYTFGQKITVSLNKYELLQIQSHDLSGTSLVSSAPLAVVSSHEYIKVGTATSKDFMQTMLPPVTALSTSYVVFGFPMYTKTQFVRVVTARNNTTIHISAAVSATIFFQNKGSIHDFEVAPGEGGVITADREVIVAMVSRGRSMTGAGDPRVIIALSNDHFLSEYTFPVANMTGKRVFTHHIVIVSQTTDVSGILLDGTDVSDLGLAWTELTGTNMSTTHTTLDVGVHSLRSNNSVAVFGGYLVGHGSTEEYGTLTGRYLGNTNQSLCAEEVDCNFSFITLVRNIDLSTVYGLVCGILPDGLRYKMATVDNVTGNHTGCKETKRFSRAHPFANQESYAKCKRSCRTLCRVITCDRSMNLYHCTHGKRAHGMK